MLEKLTYANDAVTDYVYDDNNRLKELTATVNGMELQHLTYAYDKNNNITKLIDGAVTKNYTYDKNNQLIRTITPGKTLENIPTPGSYGITENDQLGRNGLDFTVLNAIMKLDYASSSIGIDFGMIAGKIKQLQLVPEAESKTHRINQRTISIYTSTDNITYSLVPKSNWTFEKDDNGLIKLTFNERIATRYLKVHVKYDDRTITFGATESKASFINKLAQMLRVYQEGDVRTEEYGYDQAGNRILQRVTLAQTNSYTSVYYPNSDRLKTDGKYTFEYDDNGNMTRKYSDTENWVYSYDLLNRLTSVTKNGTIVSEYGYDPSGLRVVKKAQGVKTHYIFEGTNVIFEKKITENKIKNYVYAFGKHLARVDGVMGDDNAKKYFYHTDHLGSIKAVTDIDGKIVFKADYRAFGTRYGAEGDFDEAHGFNGKEFDSDTGLYYYNARWYDPDLGRFISEDPAADPNNPNLYTYGANNPLRYVDPTGMYNESDPDYDYCFGYEDDPALEASRGYMDDGGSDSAVDHYTPEVIDEIVGERGQAGLKEEFSQLEENDIRMITERYFSQDLNKPGVGGNAGDLASVVIDLLGIDMRFDEDPYKNGDSWYAVINDKEKENLSLFGNALKSALGKNEKGENVISLTEFANQLFGSIDADKTNCLGRMVQIITGRLREVERPGMFGNPSRVTQALIDPDLQEILDNEFDKINPTKDDTLRTKDGVVYMGERGEIYDHAVTVFCTAGDQVFGFGRDGEKASDVLAPINITPGYENNEQEYYRGK